MRLVLSGEGPTDLGHEKPTTDGAKFVPGPMAWMVDRLLDQLHTGYSMLETHHAGGDCVTYVDKTALAASGKRTPVLLSGEKYGKGTAYFTRNAQVLGLLANEISTQEKQPVLAVLFRDGDGTRATSARQWREKVDSMHRGFALAKCNTGVPMMPRPKSEAWLLCALRPPGYTNCALLEDESGNDDSPNALKKQLTALHGGAKPTADEQADWVTSGKVDPLRIDMPSFNAFKELLHKAAQNAGLPLLRETKQKS